MISGDETQTWYADDTSTGGKVSDLRRWWDKLQSIGPLFGYHPNPDKTWLLVKPEYLQLANKSFQGTGVNITEGLSHLGAALGSDPFAETFILNKGNAWVTEVNRLSEFAQCHPQAKYTVLTDQQMDIHHSHPTCH